MDLEECYLALGGDYAAVLGRLRSEKLVERFFLKFSEDKSFAELEAALSARDGETAFRAAHTLKGVCQNLGFDRLGASGSALTEALRGGVIPPEAAELFSTVKEDYQRTMDAIRSYQAGKE